MPETTRWIAAAVFIGILLLVGMFHLAFRASARLYENMYATDEKQTKVIFELEKRINEIDKKLVVFEQNLKFDARGK